MTKLAKALAQTITPIIMVPLGYFGITSSTTVDEAIALLIVGVFVGGAEWVLARWRESE